MTIKEERESKLGNYHGYSKPIYEEWVRTSQYIMVRDGTKLAADIFRPGENGKPVSEPLPVIWEHRRYHRARLTEQGGLRTMLDNPILQKVLKHGYVIAVVDVRGGGASYGTRQGEFTREEALDAYDVTEWLATQPWCNGNVGMYGLSYSGIAQYMAASTAPPHLKAIFPEMAMFDLYSFVYPGGVFRNEFVSSWALMTQLLDKAAPAVPVDEDIGGTMLTEARRGHQANRDVLVMASQNVFRDSLYEGIHYSEWSPSSYISEIKQSGVAIYHLTGWYDLYPRDQLTWFNNLNKPQKIAVTPWSHSSGWGDTPGWRKTISHLLGFDFGFDEVSEFHVAELLRWFDYWLKGINSGIMDEPPVHYYVMGASKEKAWKSASQWPLPEEKPTRYYFLKGPSGSMGSINDGLLSTERPANTTGQDDCTVDYTTTTGKATRWVNGHGGPFEYPDMTVNDEKALTYTTPPLGMDVEVTGHPVIHLWVTSTAEDGDFFAYLEDVDEDKYAHYLSEGVLRASHRALATPPFEYMGLPYHRNFKEDVAPLSRGEPMELVFDLLPISNIFKAGHRIRVTITCADKDNYLTPELSPAPTVNIYRNANYASYIILPIIPASLT